MKNNLPTDNDLKIKSEQRYTNRDLQIAFNQGAFWMRCEVEKLNVPIVEDSLFCECLTPELMGRYTDLVNMCTCGKKISK